MTKDSDIISVIEQRRVALDEAAKQKQNFFDVAIKKLSRMVELLNTYNMKFIRISITNTENLGVFSENGVVTVMVTAHGVFIMDTSADVNDPKRYVGICTDAYNSFTSAETQGHLINTITHLVKNVEVLMQAELDDIKKFYEKQLEESKTSGNKWHQLAANLA